MLLLLCLYTPLLAGAAGTMSPLVTCQRTDGSPFPSGALYKILLTAKFMCGSNALRAFSSANFRIQETPKIIVLQQGAKRPLVCSDAGQVTVEYNYTMTGDQGAGQVAVTAAATSSGPGISCTAVLSKGGLGEAGPVVTDIRSVLPVSGSHVTCYDWDDQVKLSGVR